MNKVKIVFLALLFFSTSHLSAQLDFELEEFATGFNNIVKIASAGDDRLFIVERSGVIKIIDGTGTTLATPFLDIDNQVAQTGGQSEQGLLGLTFHPDYSSNGYFYIHYTDNSGDSEISRYSVSSTDPNVADANSEFSVMTIVQPFGNHNGGELEFGPDGYLYIGMGDGGSGNDPGNRSQNPMSLFGKMLRIDISQEPYAIPADNPFVDDAAVLDEIWALGLRNPWRFSFDAMTGDLWIADVGQWAFEEIDFQPANSTGGENYGWRCREGSILNTAVNTTACGPATDYVEPIYEYLHTGQNGPCSITGGFIYRGCVYPELHGYYLYSDHCTGDIWGLKRDPATNTISVENLKTVATGAWTTFGQDNKGELYIAGLNNGTVFHIASGEPISDVVITGINGSLSAPDNFDSYQWLFFGIPIIGATNMDFTALDSGDYSVIVTNASGCSYTSNTINVVITSEFNITSLTSFQVQPNPFDKELTLALTFDQTTQLDLQIYSLDGKIVYQKALKAGTNISEKIDLEALESAVYLLHLTNGTEELVYRIVKK